MLKNIIFGVKVAINDDFCQGTVCRFGCLCSLVGGWPLFLLGFGDAPIMVSLHMRGDHFESSPGAPRNLSMLNRRSEGTNPMDTPHLC